MTQQLLFSCNWNKKLDCDYFTTLRLSDRFKINDEVEIVIKGESKGLGTIVNKTSCKLNELDVFTCALDTGYGVAETQNVIRRMYPNTDWEKQPIYRYLIKKQKLKNK